MRVTNKIHGAAETAHRYRRLYLSDDPETGLLVRALGSLLLGVPLLSSLDGPVQPDKVLVIVGFAAWLVFALFATRARRVALFALAACAQLAAAAAGPPDTVAVAMYFVALLVFVAHVSVGMTAVIAVSGLTMAVIVVSCFVADQLGSGMLGKVALAAVATMLGLNRRHYRLRAAQTEELLDQSRQAQRERDRAAALAERTRIAREIHDVLAHSLGALGVQLQVAEAMLAERNDPAAALDRVRRSRRLASDGLVEARHAVAALRSDTPPLADALEELAEQYRHDHDLKVDIGTEGEKRAMPSIAEFTLLRTAREALTNVTRHAPGADAVIKLVYLPDQVRLTVSNEITASRPVRTDGHGINGMRERLELLGGTMTATPSEDGRTWQVRAEVPSAPVVKQAAE